MGNKELYRNNGFFILQALELLYFLRINIFFKIDLRLLKHRLVVELSNSSKRRISDYRFYDYQEYTDFLRKIDADFFWE